MEQAHRIISFDYVQGIILIKYCKDKAAFHSFSHILQTVKVQFPLFLYELHSDVAVSINMRTGNNLVTTQLLIVPEYAIMSE